MGVRFVLGALSVVVNGFGMLWLLAAFMATEAHWWASIWVFVSIFGVALVLGVAGIRARGGRLGIVLAILGALWAVAAFSVALALALTEFGKAGPGT